MNTPNWSFVTVCSASLVCALLGWVTPPSRSKLRLGECMVFVAGLALAPMVQRGWLNRINLALLFPLIYSSFNGWLERTELPKHACYSAFSGASWFLLCTTQRWDAAWVGAAFGVGGPYFAYWVTTRVNRQAGLALVIAATLFQLTRVPLLLAN